MKCGYNIIKKLGGGFKYFLFSPPFGEYCQFDSYFSRGLKPPTRKPLYLWSLETPYAVLPSFCLSRCKCQLRTSKLCVFHCRVVPNLGHLKQTWPWFKIRYKHQFGTVFSYLPAYSNIYIYICFYRCIYI